MTLKARIRAIDRFVKGCREDGIYDDLNACCVMAGWDSLAGALTPLKGAAPTNSGFIATDYDRGGIGITGDGTSYLNSGRAVNADAQNDAHLSVFIAAGRAAAAVRHAGVTDSSASSFMLYDDTSFTGGYVNTNTITDVSNRAGINFFGAARVSASQQTVRVDGVEVTATNNSLSASTLNSYVFCRNLNGTASTFSDATLSFYSLGSATDLALLDARVSTLMADLRAIEETGFDRDALAYIRAVEAADGAYLETDVKIAINNLVAGLKADDLWDKMASTCLLCGPRTLAGALVPLRGDAPTAYGFVEGDYTRGGATPGLKGDGTSYLDSERAGDDDPPEDHHQACYATEISAAATHTKMGAGDAATGGYDTVRASDRAFFYSRNVSPLFTGTGLGNQVGFYGYSRTGATLNGRANDTDYATSKSVVGSAAINLFVFGQNAGGSLSEPSQGRMAFYSIGTSLDLAKLDSHISSYVTAIGAAI